jgi:hypothetical protein
MAADICTRCRCAPVLAICLCRACGLRQVEAQKVRNAERQRRQRAKEHQKKRMAAVPVLRSDVDA